MEIKPRNLSAADDSDKSLEHELSLINELMSLINELMSLIGCIFIVFSPKTGQNYRALLELLKLLDFIA